MAERKVKIDFDQIRELLAVVSQTDISELTIESGEEKITVKKGSPAPAPGGQALLELPAQAAAPSPAAALAEAGKPAGEPVAAQRNGLVPITSPMVGTFYRSPSPSAAPFVEVGDHITVGQTVCIIEAMKLMNDLPAEVAGRIARVCAENGTTVEYGQPLFMVDPNS